MTLAILCSHTTQNPYCYCSWDQTVHIQTQQILLISPHILYIHSIQLSYALVLQFMNRLFTTLHIFPQKTAVFQLSLNPFSKASFTLLSSHGFPLVSPAVTLKTQSGLLWPIFPTLHIPHNKTYRMAKTTRCMPNAMKSWGKGSSSSHKSRAPSQPIYFHPQQGRSNAWHHLCYHKPDWYPFNSCMLISASEPYTVYVS